MAPSTETWDPSRTREENNLFLTDQEKADIREKLADPAEDGHLYADAVFEGGGVKGTAFIGALRCFDDVGIKWRKVAGTSAGAITAALLTAGLSMDHLESIIANLDYKRFLTEKNRFIFNGSPADDLNNPVWMMLNLLVARHTGQYSSDPFFEWLHDILKETSASTFRFFLEKRANHLWYEKRDLKIVVSDISREEMLVLPDDLDQEAVSPEEFKVAEAVRLSMTIPLFFEPGTLERVKLSQVPNSWQVDGHGLPTASAIETSAIVDGGILSNFPLWIYDAPPTVKPRCPTFGFQLVEHGIEETDDGKKQSTGKSKLHHQPTEIKGAFDVLAGVLKTMMVGRDRRHLRLNDQGRVLNIYTLGISTTDFDLSSADKARLYTQGYRVARKFLKQWSWEKHLEERGFPQ